MDKNALQKLIDGLAEAKRELDKLTLDEELSHDLGDPCTPRQIAGMERIAGGKLPETYQAFLELHNGWSDFAGSAKLLAVEDHESEWVKMRIKELGYLFEEFETEDPFKLGAIPILLGRREQDSLLLEPSAKATDKERGFLAFNITRKERRYKDFSQFLEFDLKLTQKLIANEKKGAGKK